MVNSTTLLRIKDILVRGIKKNDDEFQLEQFACHFNARTRVKSDPGGKTDSDQADPDRDKLVIEFCQRLYDATSEVETHVERLDEVYSELFSFHIFLRPDQTVATVSEAAHTLLRRLPIQPLGLPGIANLPDAYFDQAYLDEVQGDRYTTFERRSRVWPCLKVAVSYSTNVLKVVLFREVYQQRGSEGVEEKQLVDLTAELLHTCCKIEMELDNADKTVSERWLIVRCFLWASWQRAQMLFFYRILYMRLLNGIESDLGSLTVLRSTLVAPDLTIQQFSDQVAFEGKSPYMCAWAFNLLRTDAIAVGSDFRLLHLRYNQLLGHNDSRCGSDSSDSCDGSQLGNCKRSMMEVQDQSMHDHACDGDCPKLTWDEQSYRSVRGGRVVDASIDDKTDYENLNLKYKPVSANTMAITHAWAHGQGGRPSTGLNQCLHIRYVQLAHQHGCDGYFIDTACIPEDHDLRKEAIMNINATFKQSKMTLIVDKDLLTVDISTMSTELQECLLAAILVSDWNVRAWTLLEAMKGRRNIHILCRHARSFSYRELVQAAAAKGRIDIAIFALLAPHLISWVADPSRSSDTISMVDPTLEMAGTLLSYRPSSRLGDDMVIWSLMIDHTEILATDAEEFWHHQRNKHVTTGFLVSNADRVGKKGLSWAPNSPYAAPKHHVMPSEKSRDSKVTKQFFRAFTGEESEYAYIDERGIFAKWCVYEFDVELVKTWIRRVADGLMDLTTAGATEDSVQRELDCITTRFLTHDSSGAIIQPKRSAREASWSMHQHIADYSGGSKGTLLVVLGSKKADSTIFVQDGRSWRLNDWTWRGVYEWPSNVPLPNLQVHMLWIS